MFGIGIPELILILIVGLIVFGPSKLPEVGRAVGKGLREFKKASSALTQAINAPDPPPPSQSHAAMAVQAQADSRSPAQEPQEPAVPRPTQESVRRQLAEQRGTGDEKEL